MIHAHIAYGPERRLADAYNDVMWRYNSGDWVVLMDQDVFLCNPYWNQIVTKASLQKEYGVISCKTNGKGMPDQKFLNSFGRKIFDDNPDINYHIQKSMVLYNEHGNKLVRASDDKLTGFFMLVNWDAWKAVGGFRDVNRGVCFVDYDFTQRVSKAGYKLGILPGLYVYHRGNLRKVK